MHRDADRTFAHGQTLADPFISSALTLPGYKVFGLLEQSPRAIGSAFAFQSVHSLLEDGEGPLPQKLLFRSIIVGRFQAVAFFRPLLVQRNENEFSAPFLAVSTAPFP